MRTMKSVGWSLLIPGVVTAAGVAIWMFGARTHIARTHFSARASATPPSISNSETRVVAWSKFAEGRSAIATQTFRDRLRQSNDHAVLVREIADAANAGNAEAQYVTALALRYCDQMLRLYFIRQNGKILTLEEMQAERARRPGGISPEQVEQIYHRCHGFLDDQNVSTMTGLWEQWLDRAVSARYPAAMAEKADRIEADVLLAAVSQEKNTQFKPGEEDRARKMALSAVQSGDPDAIFLMSDWVRGNGRSPDQVATIIGAWRLLACQRGYDCGHSASWLESACYYDPQCAGDQDYNQYFQRTLGSQYGAAEILAMQIGEAIAAKDSSRISDYL